VAKQDVIEDLPAEVPRKRRELERVPDVWLRLWKEKHQIPSIQARIDAEIERRKKATRERRVGVLLMEAGYTRDQAASLVRELASAGATEVTHAGVPSRIHTICKAVGVPVVLRQGEPREVIANSDLVIALSNTPTVRPYSSGGIWSLIGSARHRSVPVLIIMPDGGVQ
jgi:hypothetical protein